jgi:hypothetical protein
VCRIDEQEGRRQCRELGWEVVNPGPTADLELSFLPLENKNNKNNYNKNNYNSNSKAKNWGKALCLSRA